MLDQSLESYIYTVWYLLSPCSGRVVLFDAIVSEFVSFKYLTRRGRPR